MSAATVAQLITPEIEQEGIKSILFNRAALDAEYRSDLGATRRFMERFHADDTFREACRANPAQAASQWGLKADPEGLRPLWDPERGGTLGALLADTNQSLSLRRACAYSIEKHVLRNKYRSEAAPLHPKMRVWRQRQVTRAKSELGAIKAEQVVHAPFAIEFGRGCSVGCWFCGVNAPKLGDQFLYTPENRRLWRECLEVLRELVGPTAARWGFCYWASDPLDNPDYEQLLMDYHELLGHFPQTTTAQAQKHVDRVKKLLRMSEEKGGYIERFSVLTLRQWAQIHEAFTAEEMLFVESIPQNKEAKDPLKSISGRALEKRMKLVAKGLEKPLSAKETSTIACVTGFIINMLDRSVRLITPCNANERWPLGYWVLGQGTFQDGASFRRLLSDLMNRLDDSLRIDDRLRLRPDLKLTLLDDGFTLASDFHAYTFRHADGMRKLGELLLQGGFSAAELAARIEDETDVPMATTFFRCNRLLDGGLLDEQPEGAQDQFGQWIPAPAATLA